LEGNQIPDHELIEKLNQGNVEAFNIIFKRYSHRLYGYAIKYLKSKEETEGLVQDVFVKIWDNRKKIKKETSLKSYLFTIAYHNMCGIFRKRKTFLKGGIEDCNSNEEKSYNPEEQCEYTLALERVNKIIAKLPEKQKQIFIKSRKEGKTTREIAEEMNLAPGTIDNNISAALKFLRIQISKDNFELLLLFAIFFQ
jgi:RNA polymerase sigma-70 factor (ECF subfamily)